MLAALNVWYLPLAMSTCHVYEAQGKRACVTLGLAGWGEAFRVEYA